MEEEKLPFRGFSQPYMRLYEEDEEEDIYYCRNMQLKSGDDNLYDPKRPIEVTLEADDSQSVFSDPDVYRMYHFLRLCGTMKGFYSGQLDLSGRHPWRFNEVSKRFIAFQDNFKTICPTVREEEYEDKNRRGELVTFVKYIMTDEERWKEFRLKWKLPRALDFGSIKMWIDGVAEEIEKLGMVPKFQEILITDLPPELVHHIFALASLDGARLLASTCRRMKTIGISYLYHTRTIKLNFVPLERWAKIRWEEDGHDLDVIAQEKSEELLNQVDFLQSRPDLTDAIQYLSIIDGWTQEGLSFQSFLRPYTYDQMFYGPINTSLNGLLASCVSLTRLTVAHFAITSDWLRTISHLGKLRDIDFHMARIVDEAVEDDIINDRIPPSPQVLNISWLESCDDEDVTREQISQGLWCTLILFPNLLTFSRRTTSRVEGFLPDLDIQRRCPHFCTHLRRLVISLDWMLVPRLTAWVTSALSPGARCTLTHLKLETYLPHPDSSAISLLEALQSAPLEVLVLEGTKDGSLELFERIASLFPDLLGLTIIRRENMLQRHTDSSRWPHQCGEYALAMRGFRRLKYFGWNFYVPLRDATPATLLGFEERAMKEAQGAPQVELREEERSIEDYQWQEEEIEGAYFQDAESMVLPFAAYCPTLELLGLEARWRSHFNILRAKDHGIRVKGDGVRIPSDTRTWNPSDFDRGWEPITPSQNVSK